MKLKTEPKSKTKLNPCSKCGETEPIVWQLPGANWVECPKCKTTVPMEDSRLVAIRKWNVMRPSK